MGVASILLVVLAVSLDGIAVGFTYGMRGIRIPIKSAVVIGFVSSAMAGLAVVSGAHLGRLMGPVWAAKAGAGVLILMGMFLFFQTMIEKGTKDTSVSAPTPEPGSGQRGRGQVIALRLKPLGLVIEVWRDPGAADLDRSGRLEWLEAAVLGVSLALDALGAGLGIAMTGHGFLYPLAVGPVQVAFVKAGQVFAGRWRIPRDGGVYRYVPAGILMVVGLIKMV